MAKDERTLKQWIADNRVQKPPFEIKSVSPFEIFIGIAVMGLITTPAIMWVIDNTPQIMRAVGDLLK